MFATLRVSIAFPVIALIGFKILKDLGTTVRRVMGVIFFPFFNQPLRVLLPGQKARSCAERLACRSKVFSLPPAHKDCSMVCDRRVGHY